jgi:hypothetical protein
MAILVRIRQIFVTRKILSSILWAVVPALIFYAVAVLVLSSTGFTLKEILRDPAQQLGFSSFMGFISNIGVWLWVSSTAICCYSLITCRLRSSNGSTELVILLGLLSLLLAVDDFFLLHERYVDQKGIFLFYAICALALLVRHNRKIIDIDGFSFLLAGALLAISVVVDMKQRKIPLDYAQVQLIEDGCKFVGAAIWLFFCGQVVSQRARQEYADTSL